MITSRPGEAHEGADIKFPHLHANDVCIGQLHIDCISRLSRFDKKEKDLARIIDDVSRRWHVVFQVLGEIQRTFEHLSLEIKR